MGVEKMRGVGWQATPALAAMRRLCHNPRTVSDADGVPAEMEFRFRILLLSFVAVIAAAVWTFPAWRGYLPSAGVQEAFPGLELDLQDEFLALPSPQRSALLELHGDDPQMALEMARIAVREPDAAPASEQDIGALAEATALVEGSFIEIDALHWADGSATLYQLENQQHILRFEDFISAPGGDVYVYLARDPQPQTALEVGRDFLDLGRLKGTVGSQNYPLPSNHGDLSGYQSAVIFCRQFNAVISSAFLR